MPDVGRITDGMCKFPRQVREQKISVDDPRLKNLRGAAFCDAVRSEHLGDSCSCALDAVRVNLNGSNRTGQAVHCIRWLPVRYVGRQQPFNHGQKKIAIAEGRLEDSELVEGQILRVASQIENELDYFATRENRTRSSALPAARASTASEKSMIGSNPCRATGPSDLCDHFPFERANIRIASAGALYSLLRSRESRPTTQLGSNHPFD